MSKLPVPVLQGEVLDAEYKLLFADGTSRRPPDDVYTRLARKYGVERYTIKTLLLVASYSNMLTTAEIEAMAERMFGGRPVA